MKPVFLQTKFICRLDSCAWVSHEACAQAAQWGARIVRRHLVTRSWEDWRALCHLDWSHLICACCLAKKPPRPQVYGVSPSVVLPFNSCSSFAARWGLGKISGAGASALSSGLPGALRDFTLMLGTRVMKSCLRLRVIGQ